MNLKRYFQATSYPHRASAALVVLRIVAGLAFTMHGWGKIQNPFSWMGPDAKIPGFFLFLAALSEFAGGIAWILGFLTPLASLGMFFTMLVAVIFHGVIAGDPFVSQGGASYELALVYLSISLVFMTIGPGKFSLDKMIFGDRDQ